MSGWSWLVSVVKGIPDSTLCLTSFIVLHNPTCGLVCIDLHYKLLPLLTYLTTNSLWSAMHELSLLLN